MKYKRIASLIVTTVLVSSLMLGCARDEAIESTESAVDSGVSSEVGENEVTPKMEDITLYEDQASEVEENVTSDDDDYSTFAVK